MTAPSDAALMRMALEALYENIVTDRAREQLSMIKLKLEMLGNDMDVKKADTLVAESEHQMEVFSNHASALTINAFTALYARVKELEGSPKI